MTPRGGQGPKAAKLQRCGDSDFVVVANRLPVDLERLPDGTTAWKRSPGGLVTALEPLLRRRLEVVLGAGVAAALWAAVPPVLSASPAPPDGASLASWLEHRDLRQGIAGYWQANSVTVVSGGQVTMRAVKEYAGAGLQPYAWESDMATLNPRTNSANFLIASAPGIYGGATVTEQEAIARFGPPFRTYRFEQYTILVWRKNLLAELAHG